MVIEAYHCLIPFYLNSNTHIFFKDKFSYFTFFKLHAPDTLFPQKHSYQISLKQEKMPWALYVKKNS